MTNLWPSGDELLHRNPVRTRRPCIKDYVEIDVKTFIELQVILGDAYDADVVISFVVNLAEVVFVQEIIGNN